MDNSLITLSLILTLTLIGVNTAVPPVNHSKTTPISFVTPEEAKQILKKYPNHIKLNSTVVRSAQDTKDSNGKAPIYTIDHIFGERRPDDGLIYHREAFETWPTSRDTFMIVDYPLAGVGNIINFVDITVIQNSLLTNAYLLFGFIGGRSIYIMVVSEDIDFFIHETRIYGENGYK